LATKVTHDGRQTEVLPSNGRAFIGCDTVEMVRLSANRLIWMDEDGKAKRLPRPLTAFSVTTK
jgi:hypothetical protein